MRRSVVIAAVIGWTLALILFWPDIKDFLWTHPWWHSFLVAIPEIALPVLAWFELRHSREANTFRAEANRLRSEQNDLQNQIGELTAELAAERNRHLQQIAENTKKPVTQAERNADILRKHLGAKVTVSEGHGDWGSITPEIVEVSDDNIVTLFTPRGPSSSAAWCVKVQCGELEITDIPQGSCPLRLKVLKRYGQDVPLGEITKWDDRFQEKAIPVFAKGDCVGYVTFVKPGSPEKRSLYVYASRDGANSFLLEASTGERPMGDNVEISKRFAVQYVEYLAAGFTRSTASSGSGQRYQLFLPQY
jgi:hypothetical protein